MDTRENKNTVTLFKLLKITLVIKENISKEMHSESMEQRAVMLYNLSSVCLEEK